MTNSSSKTIPAKMIVLLFVYLYFLFFLFVAKKKKKRTLDVYIHFPLQDPLLLLKENKERT